VTINGWVSKLSPAGQVQWQEQLGAGSAVFNSVQQTSDGGYILAGQANSETACAANGFSSLNCAWVVKLTSAGAVQWQQVYPVALMAGASQIKQTSDGGYIVAGHTSDSNNNQFAWIAKLSPTGGLQWQHQFGTAPNALADSVAQTTDGGYIISGNSGPSGSSSVLVAKFDATGALQWQQTYGSGNSEMGQSVQQTADGGYIVGGDVVPQNGPAVGPSRALLLKLAPTGAIQFQDLFNISPQKDSNGVPQQLNSDGFSASQTPDGGYILAGTDQFETINGPVTGSWLAKTTSTGALSWQHIFVGQNGFSRFNSVQPASDGGYIAIGETGDFNNSDSVWLVKTDARGNVAGAKCADQLAGDTTVQPGALTATTTSFPSVTPPNNPPAATTDTPTTTSLVTQSVC
jgi:hypothetical protein